VHDVEEQFSRLTASLVADPVFRWRLRWARLAPVGRAALGGLLVGSCALGATMVGSPGALLDDVAQGVRSSALR
jgi:hypothetical protein